MRKAQQPYLSVEDACTWLAERGVDFHPDAVMRLIDDGVLSRVRADPDGKLLVSRVQLARIAGVDQK